MITLIIFHVNHINQKNHKNPARQCDVLKKTMITLIKMIVV